MPARFVQKDRFHQHILRNMWLLGAMLVLASLCSSWLLFVGPLTVSNRLDGSIGILLGLYICSQPAANLLDILLFMTADIRENLASTISGKFWLFMNLLTVIAAWCVIFIGILRFVQRIP